MQIVRIGNYRGRHRFRGLNICNINLSAMGQFCLTAMLEGVLALQRYLPAT